MIPEGDVTKVIEQKLWFVFLKLEKCFHVPASAVDELFSELNDLVASVLVPVDDNIPADFFSQHHFQVDH